MEWIKQIYYRFLARKYALPNSVIIETPDEDDAHYEVVFTIGAEPTESKSWKEFRPEYERQYFTGDCVSFSRTSIAEYVAKKEGFDINFSDLHLAVGSNTSLRGNSLSAPSEYFRKKGIVLQKFCNYDNDMLQNPKGTWAKRRQKVDAIPKSAKRYKGGNHSWVVGIKRVLKDALEHSPIQIAIGLDKSYRNRGIVQPPKQILTYHAVVLELIDKKGQCHIFDSLSGETKILAANYPITQAKSFRDLPVLWNKDKKKALPIFFRERNGKGVYLHGLGS